MIFQRGLNTFRHDHVTHGVQKIATFLYQGVGQLLGHTSLKHIERRTSNYRRGENSMRV